LYVLTRFIKLFTINLINILKNKK